MRILRRQGKQKPRTRREEWKHAQDQQEFSNRNNKCLNCTGDHQTRDCPTRKKQRAPTTSNPASGTGIYQNHDQFQNTSLNHNSPQQQQQSQSTVGVTTPTLIVNNPQVRPGLHAQPQQFNQQPPYQVSPPLNKPFIPQVNPLLTPPQAFNTQVLPPYFPQYPPSNSPSAGSTDSSILIALQKQWERQEQVAREANEIERQKEERKRMKEECEQRKEEGKKAEKKEMQQCNKVNKSFKKIPRFDGSAPHYCFDWLEQTEALSNRYPDRNYKEELVFNCGDSVSKTIHAVPEGATNQQIKDAVLHNHSNLCTLSQ